MITLDLSNRPRPSHTSPSVENHGKVAPSLHWVYLRMPHNTQPRWPDKCACCQGLTMVLVELILDESGKKARTYKVPHCAKCAQHQQIPIFRYRNNVPEKIALILCGVALALFGISTGAQSNERAFFFGLFLIAAVLWFAVHIVIYHLEAWRLAWGGHCFKNFSVRETVAGEEIEKVLDSCEIWLAVVAFKAQGALVFGFGSEKYAAEFKRANAAEQYKGDLPSAAQY